MLMIFNNKNSVIAACVSVLLGACAGGGGVEMPTAIIKSPALNPISAGTTANGTEVGEIQPGSYGYKSNIQTVQTDANPAGKLANWNTETSYTSAYSGTTFYSATPTWVYQTNDGKAYAFNAFTDPFIDNSSVTSDPNLPTFHPGQRLDNGATVIACCTNNDAAYYPATYLSDVRFGIWAHPDGTKNLFVGGALADPKRLQGADEDNNYTPTGKATYHIWAIRAKDGGFATSSYNRSDVYSQLTVNFNSNRVGGNIVGNDNFGDGITFNDDVRLNGIHFSGTATSGAATGQVSGSLYGNGYYTRGTEVGGMVQFGNNSSLDTVFGGSTTTTLSNRHYTGDDVTPITND